MCDFGSFLHCVGWFEDQLANELNEPSGYVLLVSHVKLPKKMKALCLWTTNFISIQTLRKFFENFDFEIFFDFFFFNRLHHPLMFD